MFGLKGTMLCAIFGSLLFSGMGYIVHDYFNVKTALKISNKQIYLLEHRRKAIDLVTAKAELDLYNNLEIQHNALYEIQHNGHLPGSSNPQWMLDYQTPRN